MIDLEGWTGDSISAAGSSAMKGNFHVAFLGGKGPAMVPTYPTRTWLSGKLMVNNYFVCIKLSQRIIIGYKFVFEVNIEEQIFR